MSRLSAERMAELYSGTLQLVAEHGYDNVTMDQIAEATRSSKATLYRQWGSKIALVVDAIGHQGEVEHELPDTGSLRGDLAAIAAYKQHDDDLDTELVTAIMHAMRQDEELAAAVRTRILDPGRARMAAMIQRAVDRGEVAADCPALRHVDLLFMAPMVLHLVLEGVEPTSSYLDSYFESVILPALGVH